MSDAPFEDPEGKLYKKQQKLPLSVSSIRLAIQQNTHHAKLKLQKLDTLLLVKILIVIVLAITFLSSILGGKEKNTPYVYGHKKIRNYFDFQNTPYHELLNSKLSKNHENIGFGVTHLKKERAVPGAPPVIANPGIFSEAEQSLKKSKSSKSIFSFAKKPKKKVYMILGKSPEVGIRHQKSKEAWLMEKLSILNKKSYAERHGYELILVNSFQDNIGLYQKRYQHEFREGWEKIDVLRRIMKEHNELQHQEQEQGKTDYDPNVEEWYWYLDIHTLIMEPEKSVDDIIFKNEKYFYRDLQYFNPNNLVVDEELEHYAIGATLQETVSLNSVDLLLTQDCNGINLNSFMVKKSEWSNLLLDVLWDPVFYSQMHTKWAKNENHHKHNGFRLSQDEYDVNGYNNDLEEKNCLEYLFNTQSWIRSKVGFMPIRAFNSLSKDFCVDENEDDLLDDEYGSLLMDGGGVSGGEKSHNSKSTQEYLDNKANFHYNETNRDFLINYMNCQKHGNCWDRFLEFSGLYEELHKSWVKKWLF